MNRVKLRILCLFFGVIALLTVWGTVQAEYEMKRVSVAGVAGRLTSASYEMSVTAVPIGGAAGVCPSGSVNSLGFWSIKGPAKVPVRLMMSRNEIDANDVDLFWTGQSTVFEVYRSTSPIDLVSPNNLYRTTGQCDNTDDKAELFDLLFFKVIIPSTTD